MRLQPKKIHEASRTFDWESLINGSKANSDASKHSKHSKQDENHKLPKEVDIFFEEIEKLENRFLLDLFYIVKEDFKEDKNSQRVTFYKKIMKGDYNKFLYGINNSDKMLKEVKEIANKIASIGDDFSDNENPKLPKEVDIFFEEIEKLENRFLLDLFYIVEGNYTNGKIMDKTTFYRKVMKGDYYDYINEFDNSDDSPKLFRKMKYIIKNVQRKIKKNDTINKINTKDVHESMKEIIKDSKDKKKFFYRFDNGKSALINESIFKDIQNKITDKLEVKEFYNYFSKNSNVFNNNKFKYFNTSYANLNGMKLFIYQDELFKDMELENLQGDKLETYLKDKLLNKLRKKLSIDWNIPIEDVDTLLGKRERIEK